MLKVTSDIPKVSTKKMSFMSLLVSLEISVHSGRAYPNSFAKFNPFCCVIDHARKHFL
jgi:hypothetical protein